MQVLGDVPIRVRPNVWEARIGAERHQFGSFSQMVTWLNSHHVDPDRIDILLNNRPIRTSQNKE